MGWAAYSNGQLLNEAEKAGFDALVTCDQNLVFQQNLTGRNIAVVILSTNIWPIIRAQPHRVQRSAAGCHTSTFENSRAPVASRIAARHGAGDFGAQLCADSGHSTKSGAIRRVARHELGTGREDAA